MEMNCCLTPVQRLAELDRLATLLQDGSAMKQKEHSGLWLVTVRWSRTNLSKSPDPVPTLDKTVSQGMPFIASGRRRGSDNYLFLHRTDAESLKERIDEKVKSKLSSKWKATVKVVEVTPEDVAHLDLDPAPGKIRNAKV